MDTEVGYVGGDRRCCRGGWVLGGRRTSSGWAGTDSSSSCTKVTGTTSTTGTFSVLLRSWWWLPLRVRSVYRSGLNMIRSFVTCFCVGLCGVLLAMDSKVMLVGGDNGGVQTHSA